MRNAFSVRHRRRLAGLLCLVLAAAHGAAAAADEPRQEPGPVRLCLPPDLYALAGMEMNVYFDNVTLVLDPDDYAFDVECPLGRQQVERWTCVPTAEEVGDHPLRLEVRDGRNDLLAWATSTLHVAPQRAIKGDDAAQENATQENAAPNGRPLRLLLVGDSLTHASVYSQRLIDLFEPRGNPRLTLIGSHAPAGDDSPNRHEGYGGWTAERFATHYKETARQGPYAQRGSPFLYATGKGEPALDFARYLQDVGSDGPPDFVTIFLGPNDIFSYKDDRIEQGIDHMLSHYDTLVGMFLAAGEQTRVGVVLPLPPAATQDAFGANYGAGQTRWQYKRNQHRLVERLLERYGGRDRERIHIVPAHVNLDCLHNYPAVEALPNAQALQVGWRLSNGVHPSAPGYNQLADTLYAFFCAVLP